MSETNNKPDNDSVEQKIRCLLKLAPGIAIAALVAAASVQLGKFKMISSFGFSALTLAIIIGMIIGNVFDSRLTTLYSSGIGFSKQKLLRLGIILYGMRLTFQDINRVGAAAILIDVIVVVGTFCLAWYAGTRVFKIDKETSMLIGAGSSICGAAAVIATEPVVKGRAEHVTAAVSTVVLFGTIAMFLYPVMWQINQQFGLFDISTRAFGIYIGSTIHEVAQVVAASHMLDAQTTNNAVITKMVRVMLLAPFLLVLSTILQRVHSPASQSTGKTMIVIPWFALLFIVAAGINSTNLLPPHWVSAAIEIDTFILSMAMGALGMTTHFSAFRETGIKPLFLAAFLFVWLVIGGALLNAGINAIV